MFVGVLMETWGVSLDWKHQMNSPRRGLSRKTGGRRKLYMVIVVVTIFKQIGLEEGGFKVII